VAHKGAATSNARINLMIEKVNSLKFMSLGDNLIENTKEMHIPIRNGICNINVIIIKTKHILRPANRENRILK
jgi:hypothetical protein